MSLARRTPAHRFGAILLLGIVICVGAVVTVGPIWATYSGTHTDLERLQKQLAKLENSFVSLGEEDRQMSAQEMEGGLWVSSRDGEISALVQSKLGRTLKSFGVTPRRISPLLASELFGVEAVVLRLEMDVPLSLVVQIVADIESQTPILHVENIDLRARPRRDQSSTELSVATTLWLYAPYKVADEGAE